MRQSCFEHQACVSCISSEYPLGLCLSVTCKCLQVTGEITCYLFRRARFLPWCSGFSFAYMPSVSVLQVVQPINGDPFIGCASLLRTSWLFSVLACSLCHLQAV